jgi:hypothetical protein
MGPPKPVVLGTSRTTIEFLAHHCVITSPKSLHYQYYPPITFFPSPAQARRKSINLFDIGSQVLDGDYPLEK